MTILTLNINGIRSALNKGLDDLIAKSDADFLCFQEVKAKKEQFSNIHKKYNMYLFEAEKHGYSGTMILAKYKPINVRYGLGVEKFDTEGRVITLEYDEFYIINVYAPMSFSNTFRQNYRNEFDQILFEYLKTLAKPIIVCGDFNADYRQEVISGFETTEISNFKKYFDLQVYDIYEKKKINTFLKGNTTIDYILVSKEFDTLDKRVLKDSIVSDHLAVSCTLNYNMEDNSRISRWDYIDFKDYEKKLFRMQQSLVRACFRKDNELIVKIQKDIVRSYVSKSLAVRQVCKSKNAVGSDGVRWTTSEEKINAVNSLTSSHYKCKPYKHAHFYDGGKKRKLNIPTYYDKAMMTLYSYALDPIAEAQGDRKSFAFRKGRSSYDADSYIKKILRQDTSMWILKCDVKSYYDRISHKWLIENIPLDKKVLSQFLKTGFILNGELFPNEDGISLGTSLSPIIGNMVLDGLENYILSKISYNIDYKYGNVIRYADDFVVTCKDKEQAIEIKSIIENFLEIRGLRLNEEKTNIHEPFEPFVFLNRVYQATEKYVKSYPSEKGINKFEKNLYNKIIGHSGSIEQMIKDINYMLCGFSTYYKVCDCENTFRKIDVLVDTLLLKKVEIMHQNVPRKRLISMYWIRDYKEQMHFKSPINALTRVVKLKDIRQYDHKKVRTNFNPYLDDEYYNGITKERDKRKALTPKNRKIWNETDGKCYYCDKNLLTDHIVSITKAENKKDVYIHERCSMNEFNFEIANEYNKPIDLLKMLEEIKSNHTSKDEEYVEKIKKIFNQELPQNAYYELYNFVDYLHKKYKV